MEDRYAALVANTLTDLSIAPVMLDRTPVPVSGGDADVLRRHIRVYLDLITHPALVLGDRDDVIRRAVEGAAHVLDIARVSVWLLDARRTKITCEDLFERSVRRHSAGAELTAAEHAPYFAALQHERTIAAHDALTDPRTSCFAQDYLAPLGIGAMLDVPIWIGTRMVGVVCHEHVGPARTWILDEEHFAYLMAHCVALALERAGFTPP
jgi:GAF domain-containing protein